MNISGETRCGFDDHARAALKFMQISYSDNFFCISSHDEIPRVGDKKIPEFVERRKTKIRERQICIRFEWTC